MTHTIDTLLVRRRFRSLAGAAAMFVFLPVAAISQTVGESPAGSLSSRAELEATAVSLEAQAARSGDANVRARAQAVRERLRLGDYPAGAKVTISTAGMVNVPTELLAVLNDTFTVRDGQVLQLPNLPDIPMAGVLRSELPTHLEQELARYLNKPVIRTESLLEVQVDGPVNRPGFYSTPADTRLSDLIMTAGGPAGNADVQRSVIRRAGIQIVGRDSIQTALRNGATLDQLDVRAGDQIVIGERRDFNWRTILTVLTAASSVAYLVFRLRQ